MDYKNTAEGKAVQKKYRDILYSSRPKLPPGHTKMDINNRAKIFSPFAALRGYEEEIQSEGRDHHVPKTKEKCAILYYQAFCLSVHFLLHHMVSSIESASSNKCDQKNYVHRGFVYLKDQRQD